MTVISQAEWDAAHQSKPERQVEYIEGFSDLGRLVKKMTLSMLENQVWAGCPVVTVDPHALNSTASNIMHTIFDTMVKSGKVRPTQPKAPSPHSPSCGHSSDRETDALKTITPSHPQYSVGIDLLPVATLPSHYKFTLTLYDPEHNIVWQDEKEIAQVHHALVPGEAWRYAPSPAMFKKQ